MHINHIVLSSCLSFLDLILHEDVSHKTDCKYIIARFFALSAPYFTPNQKAHDIIRL